MTPSSSVSIVNFKHVNTDWVALHLCDPFLLNIRNVTGNVVEKKCFAVWNVIQNVLLTLKPNIYCFRREHHYQHGLFYLKLLHILATSV